MRRIIFATFIALLCSNIVLAQDQQTASEDPFDLTEINDKIEELGIPTNESVSQLEKSALEFFESNNCEEALPALESFSKNANWLSNIISSGLEPYYGASYDSREDFPYRKLRPLIPIEERANELRQKRNESFVMQAECHATIGNEKEAVAIYIKALDLISLENEEWWERARTGLFEIVGFQN